MSCHRKEASGVSQVACLFNKHASSNYVSSVRTVVGDIGIRYRGAYGVKKIRYMLGYDGTVTM